MVKADIVRLIELRLKITHPEAIQQVEDILAAIKDCVVDKESVLISGFGKWVVRFKEERIGRNPKTGKEHSVSARHVVTFYPSSIWRKGIEEKLTATGSPSHQINSTEQSPQPARLGAK